MRLLNDIPGVAELRAYTDASIDYGQAVLRNGPGDQARFADKALTAAQALMALADDENSDLYAAWFDLVSWWKDTQRAAIGAAVGAMT